MKKPSEQKSPPAFSSGDLLYQEVTRQISELRNAVNDMYMIVRVHRDILSSAEGKLPYDGDNPTLLAMSSEIENLKSRPVWNETRITAIENAKDPLLEKLWAAVRGLQMTTVDKSDVADLMLAVQRLERKLQ